MMSLFGVLLSKTGTELANTWAKCETGLAHTSPRTLDSLGVVEHFMDWTVTNFAEPRNWA
jgi:hypothetical protein